MFVACQHQLGERERGRERNTGISIWWKLSFLPISEIRLVLFLFSVHFFLFRTFFSKLFSSYSSDWPLSEDWLSDAAHATFTFIQFQPHENTIRVVVGLSSRTEKFDSMNERNAYQDRQEGKQQRRRKGYTRCQLFDIYVKYFSLFYARLSNSEIKLCIVLLNGWAWDDNSSAKSNTNISHSIHPFERLVSSIQNVIRKAYACMHACLR